MSAGMWYALGRGAWKLATSKPVRLALAKYILDSVEKHDAKPEQKEAPKQ